MKISIIIPTLNRAFYLRSAIQTVLEIDDDNIELIVADNASGDNTPEIVEGFSDPRLIYLPVGSRVSMRENFNRSILASSGDYVIVIGDDDAILPLQFRFLRSVCETRKPDGISWTKATYGWPVEGYGKKTGGIRFHRDECFGAPTEYDPREGLETLMRCGLSQMYPTPNIYHGCVSRAFLDRHKPADDLFFDSVIPDVNFQFRSTFTGGHFLNLRHPFSINGYSPASTGGAHAAPAAGSDAEKVGRTFRDDNRADPYDDIIDHFLTIQMAYFSTFETLRLRGGFSEPEPDFVEWYRFAFLACRQKPQASEEIENALVLHADATGTRTQFEEARRLPLKRKRSIGERLTQVRKKLHSFRLSAEVDGKNTVLTAAKIMDTVLGEEISAIADGNETQSGAWSGAKARSRGFKREL